VLRQALQLLPGHRPVLERRDDLLLQALDVVGLRLPRLGGLDERRVLRPERLPLRGITEKLRAVPKR